MPDSLDDFESRISAAIERAVSRVRDEFQDQIKETRGELLAMVEKPATPPAMEPPAAVAATGEVRMGEPPLGEGLSGLVAALSQIDAAASQSAILSALLESAGDYASRAAVFLVEPDQVRGWGSLGFDSARHAIEQASPAATKAWQHLDQGVTHMTDTETAELAAEVGDIAASRAVLVPLVLRDRVAAALYADRLDDTDIDVPVLQVLTYMAGRAIETLPLRKAGGCATLNVATPPAVVTAPAAEEPYGAPQPALQPIGEPGGIAAIGIEAPPSLEGAPSLEPPAYLPPVEVELTPPSATAEFAPTEEVAPPTTFEAPAGIERPPSTAPVVDSHSQVIPPEDVGEGPGWAFTTTRIPTDAGDDEAHEEARRLARLLVSEIKLYNEEQVEEGRLTRDIYSRLREDIDRSRQIFEERIDETIRGRTAYFEDELVRILAGGDASALGA